MTNENIILPYKLSFIAVTAAVLMSSADYGTSPLPEKLYKPNAPSVIEQVWKSFGPGTYSQCSEVSEDIMEQIDILKTFAFQIIGNSENLKPEAISTINKRFWDLLA